MDRDRRCWGAAAFAVLVVGCGGGRVAVTPSPPAGPPPLSLDARGIAGLARADQASVRAALPGYDVRVERRSNEGQHHDVVVVSQAGEDLLEILGYDDDEHGVASIEVTSRRVGAAWPVRVGDSFAVARAAMGALHCEVKPDETVDQAVCWLHDAPNVGVLFAPDWGPWSELADPDGAASAALLAQGPVIGLYWVPGTP